LRAIDHARYVTLDSHLSVRNCLEVAVAAYPEYGPAWGWLSWLYVEEYSQDLNTKPDSLDRALDAAERAVRLAPRDGQVYMNMANVRFFRDEREAFLAAAERALELNPNDASIIAWMGHRLAYAGHWDRGLALLEKAKAMNPYHPGWYNFAPYFDAYSSGDFGLALEHAQQINSPGYVWAQAALAAAYGQLGRKEDAAPIVDRILQLKPDFETAARADRAKIMRYQPALVDQFMDGLRKAGLAIPGEPSSNDNAPPN
jgi:tetratricopeptide (TPR) repeat protein